MARVGWNMRITLVAYILDDCCGVERSVVERVSMAGCRYVGGFDASHRLVGLRQRKLTSDNCKLPSPKMGLHPVSAQPVRTSNLQHCRPKVQELSATSDFWPWISGWFHSSSSTSPAQPIIAHDTRRQLSPVNRQFSPEYPLHSIAYTQSQDV